LRCLRALLARPRSYSLRQNSPPFCDKCPGTRALSQIESLIGLHGRAERIGRTEAPRRALIRPGTRAMKALGQSPISPTKLGRRAHGTL
jgi:hypothetical protein